MGYRSLTILSAIIAVAVTILIAIPTVSNADSLAGTAPNGSPVNMAGVTVGGIGVDPTTNQLSVGVVDSQGTAFPVPISQLNNIEFGPAATGRTFDVYVGSKSSPQAFRGSTVRRFFRPPDHPDGGFVAIEPNGSEEFFIPTASLVALMPPGTPLPGAESSTDSGASPDPFSGDTFDGGGDWGSEEDEYGDDYADSDDDFSDFGGSTGLDATMEMWINIFAYAFQGIYFITYIWLIVHAYSQGDSNWGGILLFGMLCCGLIYPAKFFYAFQYRGGGRPLLLTLVIIELLVIVSLVAIVVIAGAAAVALIASMAPGG